MSRLKKNKNLTKKRQTRAGNSDCRTRAGLGPKFEARAGLYTSDRELEVFCAEIFFYI